MHIFFLVMLFCLTSCSPVIYIPNDHHVPNLNEEGQGELSFTTDLTRRFDLHSAYAIADNLNAQFNYSGYNKINDVRQNLFELGLGYSHKNKEGNEVLISTLIAFGNNINEFDNGNTFDITTGFQKAKLTRTSLIPAYRINESHFSVTFSSRISVLRFSDLEGELVHEDMSVTQFLKANTQFVLFNPNFTYKQTLSNRVGFALSFGQSFNLSQSTELFGQRILSFGFDMKI